jgi:hypothetical protein
VVVLVENGNQSQLVELRTAALANHNAILRQMNNMLHGDVWNIELRTGILLVYIISAL